MLRKPVSDKQVTNDPCSTRRAVAPTCCWRSEQGRGHQGQQNQRLFSFPHEAHTPCPPPCQTQAGGNRSELFRRCLWSTADAVSISQQNLAAFSDPVWRGSWLSRPWNPELNTRTEQCLSAADKISKEAHWRASKQNHSTAEILYDYSQSTLISFSVWRNSGQSY